MKVFPVVIQYFDWEDRGVKSELTEVLQRSDGAADLLIISREL